MTTMTLDHATPAVSPTPKWMLWTGRVLTALPAIMFVAGGAFALLNPAMMKEEMPKQGWSPDVAPYIAITEIVCGILYLIPQTAVLGAILLTGYLGGAVCSHARIGEYGNMFVPFIFGVIAWLGLWFRDARVRALSPIRKL